MFQADDVICLREVARGGALKSSTLLPTQQLSEVLEISPQTVSRRLKSLEDQGLIVRSMRSEGQYITLTSEGEKVLRKEYAEYERLFQETKDRYILHGKLVSGLGEGRYYVSLEPYKTQFLDKLGFVPYPGTFNIQILSMSQQVRKKIETLPWITIRGFTAEGRTFGDARCIPCKIEDIECAIIVPGRSHYPEDIIEVLAPVALREVTGKQDNSQVIIEVPE